MIAYQNLCDLAIKANKVSAIENYILYVLQYEEKIEARNEDFFLGIGEGDNKGELDENSMIEAMKFKYIWHKLSNKRKKIVFDYMIVLNYWARQYFNETINS